MDLVGESDAIFTLMPSSTPDIRLHREKWEGNEKLLVVVHKMNGLLIAMWFSVIGIPVTLLLLRKDLVLGSFSATIFFAASYLTWYFYQREPKERKIAEFSSDRKILVLPTMRVATDVTEFTTRSFKHEIRDHESATLHALVANTDSGKSIVVACSCHRKRIDQLAKSMTSTSIAWRIENGGRKT